MSGDQSLLYEAKFVQARCHDARQNTYNEVLKLITNQMRSLEELPSKFFSDGICMKVDELEILRLKVQGLRDDE